jgi:hypothetical protein
MLGNEAAAMRWIRENLHIAHDDMISADAIRWYELMKSDFITFLRYSLYGYALKLGVKGCKPIPEDEITTFVKEFQYKICLAASGDVTVPGLPLFAIAGVELMGEELLKKQDIYRLHPEAQA